MSQLAPRKIRFIFAPDFFPGQREVEPINSQAIPVNPTNDLLIPVRVSFGKSVMGLPAVGFEKLGVDGQSVEDKIQINAHPVFTERFIAMVGKEAAGQKGIGPEALPHVEGAERMAQSLSKWFMFAHENTAAYLHGAISGGVALQLGVTGRQLITYSDSVIATDPSFIVLKPE